MKCLIIAAGKGSRLWQKGDCKPLIRILGIPLIERVIRTAARSGIVDFCVVSGYKGEMVRNHLDRLARQCQIKITHVVNNAWEEGNGVSVLKAREYLKEPFLLLMADHLFDPTIVRLMLEQPLGQGEVLLAVDRDTSNSLINMEEVTRVRCEDGRVRDIGKGIPHFNGFDTGIFLCSSVLFEALERSRQESGDTSLCGGIRWLAAAGRVRVFDIGGRFWLDVDEPADLDKAERALLSGLGGKANDGMVARYLNRPLSVRISRRLARLPISPNQVSLLSFAVSLIGAGLLASGGRLALAAGGLAAQLASVLDGCDGELARLQYRESGYGRWLDAVLDRYADGLLLAALAWHGFSHGRAVPAFVWGFLAMLGSFMASYTADKYDRLMSRQLRPRTRVRLGRDTRVLLIFLGALLDQVLLTLAVIAVLMNGEVVRRIWLCRHPE